MHSWKGKVWEPAGTGHGQRVHGRQYAHVFPMTHKRLFDPAPEQLALRLHHTSPAGPLRRPVATARSQDKQAQIGYGDHGLMPDDEGSLSRIVQLHSLDKDYYAYRYADIVSRAMRGKFPSLWWVELFAGPGRLYCAPEDRYYEGSPVRALNLSQRFDGYVFNDLDPSCVEALAPRVVAPNVHLHEGDANSAPARELICSLVPRNALVVLYGDPAGLDLDFETLAFFAERYQHLDLLLNFPVKGIIRALTGERALAPTPGAAPSFRKAGRVLGHPAPLDLITGPRATWGPSIRDYFENRLRAVGYRAFETQVVELTTTRVPVYDLMIASRSRLAAHLFARASARRPGGQYTLNVS